MLNYGGRDFVISPLEELIRDRDSKFSRSFD